VSNALYYYKRVAEGKSSPEEKTEAIKSIEEIYVDKLINTQGYLSYLDSIGYKTSGLGRDSLTYHLAYNVFSNAEYVKSAESFTNYLNSFPQGYYKNDAKYYRAESNNVLKAYSKSLADYEAIIKDGPSKYYNKSVFKAALISFNYTQEFDKALKYYKEYETLTSDVAEKFQSQYGILKSAFKISKGEDVITYGQLVLDNIASTKEEKAAAHYYMAKVYFKNGAIEKAQNAFAQVEKLGTNNQAAESRYMIAEILFSQKLYDKSENQCEYANEKNTNYPFWVAKGLLLLSDIYDVKNDLLNARAAIEAVIENFKDDQTILTQANKKLEQLKLKEANNNRIKTSNGQLEVIKKKN
jgi:tetratricopeptide (TPR) repeat protein